MSVHNEIQSPTKDLKKDENLLADKALFDQKVVGVFIVIFVLNLIVFSNSLSDQFWSSTLNQILYFYFSVSLFRFFFHSFGFFFGFLGSSRRTLKSVEEKLEPHVSILIPAYNEEKTIGQVLQSFNRFNYSNFEVLVIDDGSKDKTYENALSFSYSSPYPLRVFSKLNGGKSSALNRGIEESLGEFIICMDADSTLSIENLSQILDSFYADEKLGALAGVVKVSENKSLLSQFQNLDYLVGHFQRKTLSLMGKVSVIPGPIGLFRKAALLSVNGYERENNTFAEDAELTLRLVSQGWKVRCSDALMAYTEGPQNIQDLIRQRYRWSRGIYQALFKNFKKLLYSSEDQNIVVLIYLMWEQIINPILDFSILFLITLYFVFGGRFEVSLVFILALFVIDTVIAYLATIQEKKRMKWLFVSFISRLSYANILLVWKILALYDEVKNKSMFWDSLERRGQIRVEPEGNLL